MTRKRIIAYSFTMVLVFTLLLEVLIRLTDPWGVSAWLAADSIPRDAHGWYEVGEYGLATIIEGQTRRVPDTQPSSCQIVAIGDSLTYGFGVRDVETWVNLLAQRFPSVEFINAGISGTNSEQIYQSIARFPEADGLLWIIVNNDNLHSNQPYRSSLPPVQRWELMSMSYLKLAFQRVEALPPIEDNPRFWRDIQAMIALDNLLIVAYDDVLGAAVHARYPERVTWIDYRYDAISFVDAHPNPMGHVALADALAGHVASHIDLHCGAPI